MKHLAGSAILALALSTGVVVQAQTYPESVSAYVRGDYSTAFAGFSKLADQGNAWAQCDLGMMYLFGQGVTKDYQMALAWLRKGAEQGNPMAQDELGFMYANGLGVPKDDQIAYFWWLLSTAQGSAYSVKSRDLVESRLTPEQITATQASARTWKPKTESAHVRPTP